VSEKKGKADPKKAKGKTKDAGKGKKGKHDEPARDESGRPIMSVAAHPRAAAQVRLAKGWGGITAFLVTAYVSLSHGLTLDVAGERALAAGVTGYIVAWGCTVMVWRQLMVAELRARVERAKARVEPPPAGAAAGASEPPAGAS